MKREIIFLTLILLSIGLKSQNKRYTTLFQTIEDSIFAKYSSDIFIDSIVNSKINVLDYFDAKDRCGIPFKLIEEFFKNGNRIDIPANISQFIEEENRISSARFKLGIWDLISYENFWFCRLTVWDKTIKNEHNSYSLIYIENELFCMTKSEWITD